MNEQCLDFQTFNSLRSYVYSATKTETAEWVWAAVTDKNVCCDTTIIKVRSHMNWWVKCISAVIAKTASRNVAFKARKLSDSIMDSQDSFIMRELEDAEVYFGDDFEEIVADAGNNADLYAANQGSTELINETYTEEVPLRFMGQDVLYHQPLSLD